MKTYLKFGTLLLALCLALPAAAMTLNEAMSALGQAKASGQLGEKPDGYLGVVQSGGQAEEIASQINQARRSVISNSSRDRRRRAPIATRACEAVPLRTC